ncbi:hypothetical protein [Longilinea arvoryzae]|nr:hypothetical protein [Longilinea arvoryzae]
MSNRIGKNASPLIDALAYKGLSRRIGRPLLPVVALALSDLSD